jgi:hypothetical protein
MVEAQGLINFWWFLKSLLGEPVYPWIPNSSTQHLDICLHDIIKTDVKPIRRRLVLVLAFFFFNHWITQDLQYPNHTVVIKLTVIFLLFKQLLRGPIDAVAYKLWRPL